MLKLKCLIFDQYVTTVYGDLKAFNAALQLKEVYLKLARRIVVFSNNLRTLCEEPGPSKLEVANIAYINASFTAALAKITAMTPQPTLEIQRIICRLHELFERVAEDLHLAMRVSEDSYKAQVLLHKTYSAELMNLTNSFAPKLRFSDRSPGHFYWNDYYHLYRVKVGQTNPAKILNVAFNSVTWCYFYGEKLIVALADHKYSRRLSNQISILDLHRDFAQMRLPKKFQGTSTNVLAYFEGFIYSFAPPTIDLKNSKGERYSLARGVWGEINPLPVWVTISTLAVAKSQHSLYAIGSDPYLVKLNILELCHVTLTWRVLDLKFPNFDIVTRFVTPEFPDSIFFIQGYWLYEFNPITVAYQQCQRVEVENNGNECVASYYFQGKLHYFNSTSNRPETLQLKLPLIPSV